MVPRPSVSLSYTPPASSHHQSVSVPGTTSSPAPRPPAPRLHDCELLVPTLECALVARVRRGDARIRAATGGVLTLPAGETPTAFHALEPPSISLSDYLSRIARYGFCSRSVFVAAVLYLDQLTEACPELEPNSLTIHRLLITAAMLATKSLDDLLYDNQHWSRVGGLDLAELNLLEIDMLRRLQFKLHISQRRFLQFETGLVNSVLTSKDSSYRNLRYSLGQLGFDSHSPTLPPSPQSVMGAPDRLCHLFRVDSDNDDDKDSDSDQVSDFTGHVQAATKQQAAVTSSLPVAGGYYDRAARSAMLQRWHRQ